MWQVEAPDLDKTGTAINAKTIKLPEMNPVMAFAA
jgi:hypothetical protein